MTAPTSLRPPSLAFQQKLREARRQSHGSGALVGTGPGSGSLRSASFAGEGPLSRLTTPLLGGGSPVRDRSSYTGERGWG